MFPNQGHLGANGLFIPDHSGADPPWSGPKTNSVTFFEGEIDRRMTLTPPYADFDAPGKLMNILMKSSPETSPKIPAFRKRIKTLRTKDPVHNLLGAHLCLPPTSFLKHVSLLSFS